MNTLIIFSAKYLLLAVVLISAFCFWMQPRENKKAMFLFGLLDCLLILALGWLAGHFYYNPRPFMSDGVVPLFAHAAVNGFPSNHMLLVSALSSIVFCYSRRLGLLSFLFAFTVGGARVLAGIHHWTDIFGSFAIAVVATAVLLRVLSRFYDIVPPADKVRHRSCDGTPRSDAGRERTPPLRREVREN